MFPSEIVCEIDKEYNAKFYLHESGNYHVLETCKHTFIIPHVIHSQACSCGDDSW